MLARSHICGPVIIGGHSIFSKDCNHSTSRLKTDKFLTHYQFNVIKKSFPPGPTFSTLRYASSKKSLNKPNDKLLNLVKSGKITEETLIELRKLDVKKSEADAKKAEEERKKSELTVVNPTLNTNLSEPCTNFEADRKKGDNMGTTISK
jgi:hypothetical protein